MKSLSKDSSHTADTLFMLDCWEVEIGVHLEEIRAVAVQRILAMRRIGRIFAVRHQE
jgi:hypothetical protein